MQRLAYQVLFLSAVAAPLFTVWHGYFRSAADLDPSVARAVALAWVILVIASLFKKAPTGASLVSCGVFWLISFAPFVLAIAYYVSAPAPFPALLALCAIASLLPLGFMLAWRYKLGAAFADDNPLVPTLISLFSMTCAVVLLEMLGPMLLEPRAPSGVETVNSSDRKYWFYAGTDTRNSLGMHPATSVGNTAGKTVLVLGDSMPAAKRKVNFVSLAGDYLATQCASDEMYFINAGMAGFSFKQIELFYAGNLGSLNPPPRIVVISFYLDDISRELRYRKGRYLYSPLWPEWMQDVYYGCLSCRSALNIAGFTHNNFQLMRSKDYRRALPETYRSLSEIVSLVRERHGIPVLLNVPGMVWQGVLHGSANYPAAWFNRKIQLWAENNDVVYVDALSGFIGESASDFTISPSDRHFNDAGHAVVAHVLSDILAPLVCGNE